MDLLTNRVKRSAIKPGDHIYTYSRDSRDVLTYVSHHGIFVGENKVVHFTPNFYKSSLTCSSYPKCELRQPKSGIVRSCLDCFLRNGSLYRFEYGVCVAVFLAHVRSGTCSIAKSDPPGAAMHRALYLLRSGFDNYDVFDNDCEDFALYCKTGLRIVDKTNNDIGPSGRYLQWVLLLFSYMKRPLNPLYTAALSAGTHGMNRYMADIGVRGDVTRVAVEDLAVTTRPVAMPSVLIPILDGTNFSNWSEQVQLYLRIHDLDLALRTEKPPAITDSSNVEERAIYNSWEQSNRLSIMFMQMNIANNIKSTLPECDSAKEFFKIVEERFPSVDKCLTGTLMAELTTMKFDDTRGMHEHILRMKNLVTKLKALGINLGELFLMHFILNSLPLQYESFQIYYNTIKDKWNVDELTSMLVQEEAKLKQQGHHSVHFLSPGAKKIELPEVNGPPQVIEVHEKRQNNVIQPLEVNGPPQVTQVQEKRQNNVVQPPEVNGHPQVIEVHEKRQNNVIQPLEVNGPPQVTQVNEKRQNNGIQPPEVNGLPQVIEVHEKRQNNVIQPLEVNGPLQVIQVHEKRQNNVIQPPVVNGPLQVIAVHEKRQSNVIQPPEVNGPPQVIEVHEKRRNSVQCYFCKEFGHVQKNCYKHSGHLIRQGAKKMEPHKVNGPSQVIEVHDKRQNNVQCYFCKMFGHVQKNCHKRRAWFKKKRASLLSRP